MYRKITHITAAFGILLFVVCSLRVVGQSHEVRVINSVQSRDTAGGALVTIAETQVGTYVTRKNESRFQLIIPQAGASVKPGYIYSSLFVIVQIERNDKDAIFTFDLSDGAAVVLKHDTDKI
ncbi:MAG: hypothetical protein ABIV48_13315, partial [Pyrinomonadaceae bacterium]